MFKIVSAVLLALLAVGVPHAAAQDKIRVVIVDGQNNHDWRSTTPVMKDALEKMGKFTVDVSSNLGGKDKSSKPHPFATVPFPPDLGKYDVVLSNYNGAAWPKEFNDALEARLKDGKIGLVIVHAANNAFRGWNEYNQMIGMGWRGKNGGERLYLDDKGEAVKVKNDEGDNSGHRYRGPFPVNIRNADHPITKGMPAEWMHSDDELYDNMRGPIANVKLLATAYSKGTKVHEPMIWTIDYGKGRVFHTPMGHSASSMMCIGFQTTLGRGTEWAATGNVTLPIPENFPTAAQASVAPKQ